MSNLLTMAMVQSILLLHAQGWSQRRIAKQLGIDRGTVAKYLRQWRVASATPAMSHTGSDGEIQSKPAIVHIGSEGEQSAKPAISPTGSPENWAAGTAEALLAGLPLRGLGISIRPGAPAGCTMPG